MGFDQRGAVPIITGIVMFLASALGAITGQHAIQPAPPVSSPATVVQNSSVNPSQPVSASLTCTSTSVVLTVSGSVDAPTNGDNIWSTLTDEKAHQTIVFGLVGQGGIGGPGTKVDVSADLTNLVGSIRGQGSLALLCDGRTYTIKVYSAPFSDGVPTLTNLLAEAAVSQGSNVTPTPLPSGTPIPSSSPVPSSAPSSGNINGWSYNNPGGGVTVIPYPFISRNMFYIDFEAATFSDIANIYFNLNYDTSLEGTKRGVETTFIPTSDQIYGKDPANNEPYIRRQLFLGSCSKGVCTFDPNPIHFHLTVTTTYKDGRKVTEIFTQDNPLHN